MSSIVGIKKVLDLLGQKARHVQKFPRVIVGYTEPYAIYVHENLQNIHPVGQAKFLEQPARTLEPVMRSIIYTEMRAGKSLSDALLAAGNKLKTESQLLCPVDTGALRDSAFVSVVDASNTASSNI